jgi:hypothetical protein
VLGPERTPIAMVESPPTFLAHLMSLTMAVRPAGHV